LTWFKNLDYQELTKSVDRARLIPRTEVVLLDEWLDGESRHVIAKLTDDGNLVISGQDIGPSVERIFGSDEYEYAHTFPTALVTVFLS